MAGVGFDFIYTVIICFCCLGLTRTCVERWRWPPLQCQSELEELKREAERIKECIWFLLTGERKILMSEKCLLKE